MYEEEERALTRIVREILGGKPVSDYPFDMFPKIKNYLYELKEKAISLGQNERIKLIKRAFIEIKEVEKKHQKEILQDEKSSSETNKPSDSELEAMIDKMIAGEKIEPFNINLIPPLIKRLKKRIKNHIINDDFEMAQNYEDLHQILLTEFRNGETTGQKEWLQKTILEKLEKAEQKLKYIEEAYRQHLNENERMTAEAINKENQLNQIELNDFDAETQGPLPPFSKTFSSELQNLRETQKKLIICKRYKEAAIVRDKIKEIIEIELEGIEDKHLRSREARREQLLDSHYQKIDCILTKSDSQKINIDYIFGKKISSLKKQIDFYERQLDMINSSKRLNTQFNPAVSFDVSPDEYQPKILKSRTPMSVRQLSMREPWSLLFDASKRLNVTKIDELAEPHWKTIEPRQTDTEVYSQFVTSLVSTPKSWERVHQRKVSSAKSQRKKWQNNQSIYSSDRRNRSEEKQRRINKKIEYYENVNDENFTEDTNTTTPNRTKKKRNKQNMRSSSQSRSKNDKINEINIQTPSNNINYNYDNLTNRSKNNFISYSDNIRNSQKGKNSNIRKSLNSYSSTIYYNNSNNKSQKQNKNINNKVTISNTLEYDNLVSNFESSSTFHKSNNSNSNKRSSSKSLSQSAKYTNLSNPTQSSKLISSMSETASTTTITKSSSNVGNIQSISSSSSRKQDDISNTIKKTKKSNKSDSLELSSNIYYNGLTYTQFIDARRNKAMQTKKKKSLYNLFGEKSDFEKFCQTVPPSRKEQLPIYL